MKLAAQFFRDYGPGIVTLIGGVIAALGVYWSSVRQTRLTRMLIGGDSFCYVAPDPPATTAGSTIKLLARKSGDYPIYSPSVLIMSLTQPGLPGITPVNKIGDLLSNESVLVSNITLPPAIAGTQTYIISSFARNGSVSEMLKFAFVRPLPMASITVGPKGPKIEELDPKLGGWVSAFKVKRPDGTVLMEQVHPSYPHSALGKVEWGWGF